jgi:hypothetical protein
VTIISNLQGNDDDNGDDDDVEVIYEVLMCQLLWKILDAAIQPPSYLNKLLFSLCDCGKIVNYDCITSK